MTQRNAPWAARLYGAALWLLPPNLRREDGAEMRLAFEELWGATDGGTRRVALACRLFGALARVAGLEWLELMGLSMSNLGGSGSMSWGTNLRFAMRSMKKAPAFTVTTVMLIALGVGAVTTIFTLFDHILLRPLPYPASERLVYVTDGSHSGPLFKELESVNSVEAWAGAWVEDANLTGQSEPLRIQQADVSRRFFSMLGARPVVGRLLTEGDFAAPSVVVLSHGTWLRVFGADPAVVGRSISIDGSPVTVLGVLDADFEAPNALDGDGVDVWRPIDWNGPAYRTTDFSILDVMGRMRPGATLEDVQAETDVVLERMATLHPDDYLSRDGNVRYKPVVSLHETTVSGVRNGLNLLLGAVGVLLLVACLNVAHLFLARGLARVREMAVRRALGAGTGGLVRQLMIEALTLSAIGGLLGLGLAAAGLSTFLAMSPDTLPRASALTLDLRVVGFAASVAGATAVMFGLLPALRSVRGDLLQGLSGGARGSTSARETGRLRGALVVAEVALSLVLVAQAGLLLKSFVQVQSFDSGLVSEGVWTVPLTPTGLSTPIDYVDAMNRIEASLASLPGVASATYGLSLPMERTGSGRCCWSRGSVAVDGEVREGFQMLLNPVSSDFFETLGIELLHGQAWSEGEESEDPTPAVLAETLAVELFGSSERAVGQVIGTPESGQWRITGVAADTKYFGLDQPAPHALFLPVSRVPFALPLAHLAVRIRGEAPAGLQRSLREAVWRASPDMPVPIVRSMNEWIEGSTAGRRFDSVLFGAFGLVALVLAAAGLYGTLLYNVGQRRRELGIRLALGAARGSVERIVVARAVRLAAAGSVLGLVGAWQTGRLMEARLYEVEATDPATLASAVGVLLVTAAVASWSPARRAGRTNPIETLKAE